MPSSDEVPQDALKLAKQAGFSDRQLAEMFNMEESAVRQKRLDRGITPWVKQVIIWGVTPWVSQVFKILTLYKTGKK